MKMNLMNIRCPGCGGGLRPVVLGCDACELRVEGRFQANEFATLAEEDLHFLRIFVQCEGRIREMESALGVSYPTIKGKLAQLKASLSLGGGCERQEPEAGVQSSEMDTPSQPAAADSDDSLREHSTVDAAGEGATAPERRRAGQGVGETVEALAEGKVSVEEAIERIRQARRRGVK